MRVDFESMPWQDAAPGARFKAIRQGRRMLRILELTPEFVELDWCRKGHSGIVLEGELKIEFQGALARYPSGSGISIAAGPGAAHKARAVTARVRLFLVEDA